MTEVERVQRASSVTIEVADPLSDDARACFLAYFQELQTRFNEGFDPQLSVSADPTELVPPAGCLLIAWLNGAPVGCGALKIKEDGYGEVKRMWVAPAARGLGIAQRLLKALEEHAVTVGVRVLQLDTHRDLVEARNMYVSNGYVEIPPYNTNPYAHYWFEKRGLVAKAS